jgi:hypothetical protein
MNVEIGTEAAKFPEKEYINGIFLAVQSTYRGRVEIGVSALSAGAYITTLLVMV